MQTGGEDEYWVGIERDFMKIEKKPRDRRRDDKETRPTKKKYGKCQVDSVPRGLQ